VLGINPKASQNGALMKYLLEKKPIVQTKTRAIATDAKSQPGSPSIQSPTGTMFNFQINENGE
jgi:hypothetical protein